MAAIESTPLSLPDASVLVPRLVTDDAELQRLCQHWRRLPVLAMDSEFIRVDTFYPQLGLLQVGDGTGSYLLDPLELTDWAAFRDILETPDIVKVWHSCSEDLLVLREFFDVIPGPLFDTQKAAAFLGMGYSIGYQNLVSELLDIPIGKGETRSDWLRRPLSDKQLEYAALDVAYLPVIHDLLRQRLLDRGYLDALLEEGEQLRETARLTEDEAAWPSLYLQMGAAWRLDRDQLAVLSAISLWRELEARRRNLPRSWVAKDTDLILLAQHAPVDAALLRRIGGLSPAVLKQDLTALLQAVERGRATQLPADTVASGQPLTPGQRRQLKRCQSIVRRIAGEQGLAVELLARKKQLINLLEARLSDPDFTWPTELGGWRQALLEAPLREALASGDQDGTGQGRAQAAGDHDEQE